MEEKIKTMSRAAFWRLARVREAQARELHARTRAGADVDMVVRLTVTSDSMIAVLEALDMLAMQDVTVTCDYELAATRATANAPARIQ
jgi:hypothetical protein